MHTRHRFVLRASRRTRPALLRGVFLPLLAACVLLPCMAEAQAFLAASPSPVPVRARRPLTSIGVTAAGLYAASVGTLTAAPCNCEYKSGSGFGYDAGLLLELPVSRGWAVALHAGYMATGTLSTSPRQLRSFTSEGEEFLLEVEGRATADLQYASAGALLRVYLGTGQFYLGAGPTLTFMTRGTLKTEEWITTEGYVYPDTKTPVLSFPETDLTDASPATPGLSLDVAAGMPLVIARGTILEPELSVAIPLTRVAKRFSEWSVATVRMGISLRFGL